MMYTRKIAQKDVFFFAPPLKCIRALLLAEPMTPSETTWQESARGRLKVFLGYASGVGKSFRMFDEGRRRRERGQDVVVGAVQPEVPVPLKPLLVSLEIV